MFEPPGNVALYFRPLVSLSARRIIGFTAHSARPGDDTLRAACLAAARWPDGITLGVELAPERWQNPATGLQVLSAIGECGLSPARLELEICEDALNGDSGPIQKTIEHLRQSGAMVALSGCGRRAETVMPLACFDTIKFAPRLVAQLGRNPERNKVADALIEAANRNGVVTAADGISTNEQFDVLNGKGCATGQGSLFGKSVRASEIPVLLRYPSIAEVA